MNAYKITVSGRVQKRGYRNKVFQLANELDVNGYVKNLPAGEVEIVAEHANEAILQQFIHGIKTVNGLVRVIDAKVESLPPQGYGDFEIIRGDKQGELLTEGFSPRSVHDVSVVLINFKLPPFAQRKRVTWLSKVVPRKVAKSQQVQSPGGVTAQKGTAEFLKLIPKKIPKDATIVVSRISGSEYEAMLTGLKNMSARSLQS